ncbi:2Fe-2S iron-sulfur cluster-binding protein [Streptomyces sp. NPDC021096]|uniref:2Fe-2S iron-sulfur cluster-binding protein n=1 Tax=Streptomyces sp. NPDC021096 TaxID=3154792 RepID=UPI003405B86B
MSDEQQRQTHVPAPGAGGWQPIPQGAGLEAEGTTFLQLPPELLAHQGSAGWGPLAAPGTGYTPPAADSWPHPAPEPYAEPAPVPVGGPQEQGHWDGAYEASYGQHGQHGQHLTGGGEGVPADPHAVGDMSDGGMSETAQWPMPFAPDAGEGAGSTQQWTVPAAGDDSVEESGEYVLRETGAPGPAEQVDQAGQAGQAGGFDHLDHVDHHTGHVGHVGRSDQWSVPAAPGDTVDESGEYDLGIVDGVTGAGESPVAEWTADAGLPAQPEAMTQAEPVTEPATDPEPEPADGTQAVEHPGHNEHLEQHAGTVEHPGSDEAPAAADDTAAAAAPEPDDAPVYPHLHAEPEPEMPTPMATATGAEAGAYPEPEAGPQDEHPCASYVLSVNGTDRPVTDAWIGESLLYVLRERLGLAGAKDGCSQGECGACSVQVDGRLVASCLVPAATTAGAEIRTVEGLAAGGQPSDVQRALAECGAVQCGFCVPGLAMTVHDLLEGNHAPTELETRQAICGNLCRCSGYRGVLDAVRQVVDERAEAAAALEEDREQQADSETARIPHQAGPYGDGSDGTGGSGRAMA